MCMKHNKQDEKALALETTKLLNDRQDEEQQVEQQQQRSSRIKAQQTIVNFIFFSILFSIQHGTVTSCLHLASSQLGNIGAWQTGTLFLTYTGSALFGATYIVMSLGARDAIIVGMAIYSAYVGCFHLATSVPAIAIPACIVGAAIGGVGGGFLWTAQGAYFARSSEEYAAFSSNRSLSDTTSMFGGIFAFIYLTGEVALELLSTFLIKVCDASWGRVYAVYLTLAVMCFVGMTFVQKYEASDTDRKRERQPTVKKTTAAVQLLFRDAKMKYMIGLNFAFGFSSAFINSFVFGEALLMSSDISDPSAVVGVFASVISSVAAIMSIIFGHVACIAGKGFVVTIGAMSFFMVAFLFVIKPDAESWGWMSLLAVSAFQGIGRATFESTLRATFADFFSYEKEGAFANIILQSGLSSVVGFWLSVNLPCNQSGTYCVEFRDGALHNTLAFELIIMATSLLAILGYWRADSIYKEEVRVTALSKDIHRNFMIEV